MRTFTLARSAVVRAVDPDPHSFSLLDCTSKIAQAPMFLTFQQYFMFFQLNETLHKVIFYNLLKAETISARIKTAGSGSTGLAVIAQKLPVFYF